MRIQIQAGELLRGVESVGGVVPRKSTMPILQCIKLTAKGADVRFDATNLDVAMTDYAPAQVQREGSVCIDAKKLHSLCKALSPQHLVDISVEEKNIVVKCGSAKYGVTKFAADEFPKLPPIPSDMKEIPAGLLRESLTRVAHSISEDETRFVLNGVNVRGDGWMYSTDGHRLTGCERTLPVALDNPVIIARNVVEQALKMLEGETLEMGFTAERVAFRTGRRVVIGRLIEGKFPDVNQVIPTKLEHEVDLNKQALVDALRRVTALSRRDDSSILLKISDGHLTLRVQDPDSGESEDFLPVDDKAMTCAVRMSARYLMEAVGIIPTEMIRLGINDELSPVKVSSPVAAPDFVVVMPMRI